MIFRIFTALFTAFSLSCSSEVEETPKKEKTLEEKNAEWSKKSAEWIKEKQRINKQNTLHNKGVVLATTPEIQVDMAKFKAVQENAVKGDPDYQYSLGMCYKYGYGVKVDINKALYWFKKAADQGHKQAGRVYRFMLKDK